MNTTTRLRIGAAVPFLATAVLVMPTATGPTTVASAESARIGAELGAVPEDDSAWDCRTMGDRVCGPTNSSGVDAGCYNDSGTMVAPWPCRIIVNADGSADVYR